MVYNVLQHILDIKDGKPMMRTTEKSEFNKTLEANRPEYTRYGYSPKGPMLSQRAMRRLRFEEQLWGSEGLEESKERLAKVK